eukprot:s466_g6.t1
MMKDVSLARALQLPDRQVRQVLERRLVPDCIVDRCSEGTGDKLQTFYRISPVAVAVAAQRFQLLEMCNRVYDTMQAMSTSFLCDCGQALASTAEESEDADPPLMDPNTASGATHEIEFKKKPFGILRYAPGASGNGAVVREVKQESRYPGDPQGQAFVAGVQPGWVVASVNGQDAKNIKFEDLMEFMDDEVLDPVAALSLNLKDRPGKGIGESTFTFGGGNLAPLPIKVVYQEPSGFHVQCKDLLKLTQELENLPGPQFGHPPKVKKPRGAAKQSAKETYSSTFRNAFGKRENKHRKCRAKAATSSEQRPAPADDFRANQTQVDMASTLQSKAG